MNHCPQQIQTKYTLGLRVVHNPYHVAVVRSQLTRNIEVLYPAIRDEIVTSFDDILNLSGNGQKFYSINTCHTLIQKHLEWKSVPALSVIEKIVCRASNRAFVGLPLCMLLILSPYLSHFDCPRS